MYLNRSYCDFNVGSFLKLDELTILGQLTAAHHHTLEDKQKYAWLEQIQILKDQLVSWPKAHIFFEFSIPRMGKRVDVILCHEGIIYVLEFKVGQTEYLNADLNQAIDYALDLSNFHSGSHKRTIVPVLIATEANSILELPEEKFGVTGCMLANRKNMQNKFESVHSGFVRAETNPVEWANTKYEPTPTIVEAARALYKGHSVQEITRSEAGATNLTATSDKIAEIIQYSKANNKKSICFVTGVPGAGKTLAGLNLVCSRQKLAIDEHAVFLSGNTPLVDVLREALAEDEAIRLNITKKESRSKARTFIQNIHHFRDDNAKTTEPPVEKVVVFDEAQRVWDAKQATKFMKERGYTNWTQSEPDFLISVMNRSKEWCTLICLVGGGQEINTGDAGIIEWFNAFSANFQDWTVWASSFLNNTDYKVQNSIAEMQNKIDLRIEKDLHLAVSVRSFRAEKLSEFISLALDNKPEEAKKIFNEFKDQYPIVITRELNVARKWLKEKARGTERYGLLSHSGALRLKAEGLNVKFKIEAVDWFLKPIEDIRSSYSLEDLATEFDVQGLELDWTCVCWDGDFRLGDQDLKHFALKGTVWNKIKDENEKRFLKNSYRVILTRARQGMILYIPKGSTTDITRNPEFYDTTFEYLKSCGLAEIK